MPCTNIGPGYARLSFAVAIIENNTIVGHVSETISVPCNLFLGKKYNIVCCNWPSSVWAYRKLQGYLISQFNKYPRNPQNFLSLKLINPMVLLIDYCSLDFNSSEIMCDRLDSTLNLV